MINEVEHLFLWLLPKWMFYCETFVYIFSHLFSVVLYCILLICRSSLYILAVNLRWVYVANIFSSLVDCLFACLMESFYKTTKTLLGLLETFCLDFSFLPAVAPEIGNYCEKKTSNMPAAPYIFTKSLVFFFLLQYPSCIPFWIQNSDSHPCAHSQNWQMPLGLKWLQNPFNSAVFIPLWIMALLILFVVAAVCWLQTDSYHVLSWFFFLFPLEGLVCQNAPLPIFKQNSTTVYFGLVNTGIYQLWINLETLGKKYFM